MVSFSFNVTCNALTLFHYLSGHFVAKALVYLARDSLADGGSKNFMLWQTKSSVQPRGSMDELALMRKMPEGVKRWARRGDAASALRKGMFDEDDSKAYDSLMTRIETVKFTK